MDARAERFVRDHAAWILKHVEKAQAAARHRGGAVIGNLRAHRDRAHTLASRLVAEQWEKIASAAPLLDHDGLRPVAIRIGNQKTMWGSCSRKGTLSFNVRMLFLPEPLQEYLVVHELCHLHEFNHSPRFWALVARAVPEYKERRKELKKMDLRVN